MAAIRCPLLSLLLVLGSCLSATPVTERPTASSCNAAHMREVIEQYHRAFNERDAQAVLSLFAFDRDGRGSSLYDAPGGQGLYLTHRAVLERYLIHRFARGDRFLRYEIVLPDDAAALSPVSSFEREVDGEALQGNAKWVCSAGLLGGVVMSTESSTRGVAADTCPITPTSTYRAGDSTVHGKRDGNVFFYLYPGGQERPLEREVKFLVFLDDPGEDPPVHVRLRAISLSTPTMKIYEPGRHHSPFGWDWGMNFEFEPGCWWLEVDAPGHHGAVIVEVR